MNRNFENFLLAGLLVAVVLIISLSFSGCGNKNSAGKDESLSSYGQGLVRCQDCNDVLDWLRNVSMIQAEREVRANMENARNWYGDGGVTPGSVPPDSTETGGNYQGDDGGSQTTGDDAANQSGDDENGGANNYSNTNNQENNVDEADIVKTDGNTIFLLSGGQLILFDPSDDGNITELSRYDVEGHPMEMFISGSYAVVFSALSSSALTDDVWPDVPHTGLTWDIFITSIIDVTDLSAPVLARKVYSEGSYLSARFIGKAIRIVTMTRPVGPELATWIDPWPYIQNNELDENALWQAYQNLMDENRRIIDATTLEDWLPRYFDIVGATRTGGFLSRCEDFFHPEDPLGRTVSTVITIDMDAPLTKQNDIALLADGQLLYSSSKAIYIAGGADTIYTWSETDTQKSWIHKFALPDNGGQAVYTGSVEVTGFALNQFSMGEFEDRFHVATTSGWWGDDLNNHIYVIKQGDQELHIVGSINDIAQGESIQSARFIGDRGYLVTFKQIDPLFTVDLSVPEAPRIAGRLETPGFSTYIHPFDDNHLLTIGQSGNSTGATGGVALQLFDISDFDHPTLAFKEDVADGSDVYSEAMSDHKAFLYFQPDNLLAIPIVDYAWDVWGGGGWTDDDAWGGETTPGSGGNGNAPPGWLDDDMTNGDDTPAPPPADDATGDDTQTETAFSGVYVYSVKPDTGFQLLGKIDHTNFKGEDGSDSFGGIPIVHRSVVIGEYIYTVSDAAIVVTHIDPLEEVSHADLPYESPWSGDSWGGGWVDDGWGGGTSTGTDSGSN